MAREMGVPFLGRIPLDPALSKAAEEGRSVTEACSSSNALQEIIQHLMNACGDGKAQPAVQNGHTQGTAAQPKSFDIDPLLSSRIHLGF